MKTKSHVLKTNALLTMRACLNAKETIAANERLVKRHSHGKGIECRENKKRQKAGCRRKP
jgi:hypothetical protein